MNLTNIFNFKYMYQNIKKSKSVILLMFILFPILTSFVASSYTNGVISLSIMSIIAMFGLIIPFILSYICFGHVYKRKTVDFVNSMPISRISLFLTNTLLGAILIGVLLLVTILLVNIAVIFTNSILPFKVMLDYFILWFTVYLFVFTVSNLAMSISGNEITTIVISSLIILLIPFMNDFTNLIHSAYSNIFVGLPDSVSEEITDEYYCQSKHCDEYKSKNIYYLNSHISNNSATNFVYSRFSSFLTNDNLYKTNEIHLMLIMSVIYIILGLFIYNNKKMEITETSVKSYKVHTFIKCLTLFPFMSLFVYLLMHHEVTDSILLLIFFAIILGYYYAYDLITKKGIQNFKNSIVYFLAFFIITCGFVYLESYNENEDLIIDFADIDNVEIKSEDNIVNEFNMTKVNDRDIIKMILIYNLFPVDGDLYVVEYNIGNKKMISNVMLSDQFIEGLTTKLHEKKLDDKMIWLKATDSFALTIEGTLYNKKDLQDFDKYYSATGKFTGRQSAIVLYYYDKKNHLVKSDGVVLNDALSNYLYEFNNQKNISKIKEIKKMNKNIYIDVIDLNGSFINVSGKENDVLEYLKCNQFDKVDLRKPWITFNITIDNRLYTIIDNNTDNFYEYFQKKGVDFNQNSPTTAEGFDFYD